MSEMLPKGWVISTLKKTSTHPQYGWTCSSKKLGSLKLLRTTDISNGKINWKEVPFCEKEPDSVEKYILKADDILVSRAGSVGISYRITKNDIAHEAIFASYLIRFCPLIPASFVEYYFKSHKYWQFISDTQLGIAVPNVNATKLSGLPIPVPPLNEQKRIVAKLDAIIPRIDSVKARLESIPVIIKRFRQSVLTAAVTGKLTEKWREEHPKKWDQTTIKEQSKYVTSGSRGWAQYYSNTGAIFIRAQNINTDNLILEDVAYVALPNTAEGTRTKVYQNDILITITGANVTKTAIVRKDIGEAYVNQHIALVRLKEPAFSNYIYLWMVSSNAGRAQLEEYAYGAGKPGLNLQNIRDVKLNLPPLSEQKEIVRQVDRLFALADKLEAHYQKAKSRIDKLSQSVLAKAFRGELVPQDPNDEPAEKLLERIMEEKAKMEGGGWQKAKSRKRRAKV
ncbi:MAG: hypothetical protein A2277_08290 [Desulfobacterales bacterium RIFOXYA12_FULL_46_15]|nr:MAG: hypothetical protein A2277_08290 [Desulfobacterales bacterium RIFOXYA12_FULL_46_15]